MCLLRNGCNEQVTSFHLIYIKHKVIVQTHLLFRSLMVIRRSLEVIKGLKVLYHRVCNKRVTRFYLLAKRDSESHLLLRSLVVSYQEVENVSPVPFFVMNSVLAFICYAKWIVQPQLLFGSLGGHQRSLEVIRGHQEVKNLLPCPSFQERLLAFRK